MYKAIDQRHMPQVSERWSQARTDGVHAAFFNGAGYVMWRNVWGIWNPITDRDAALLRRAAAILRFVAAATANGTWEPYARLSAAELPWGVFASSFSTAPGTFGAAAATVFLGVNRLDRTVAGLTMTATQGTSVWDLYGGGRLPVGADNVVRLPPVEGRGIFAVLTAASAPPGVRAVLARMRSETSRPLTAFSTEWAPLPQRVARQQPTTARGAVPGEMVRVAAAGPFLFNVTGVWREGPAGHAPGVQFPWEDSPRRSHLRSMTIQPFAIGATPVTNRQFREFIIETGYWPDHPHNYLRDWVVVASNATAAYRPGEGDHPVVWVARADVDAYCRHRNVRLPRDWEWQLAAQGTDQRQYPWGNESDASRIPPLDRSRTPRRPGPVGAHANGTSPYGMLDAVGLIWQMTDAACDDRVCAQILRGGSTYHPRMPNPGWPDFYFLPALRVTEHNRLQTVWDGLDRSGMVGFRVVADLA